MSGITFLLIGFALAAFPAPADSAPGTCDPLKAEKLLRLEKHAAAIEAVKSCGDGIRANRAKGLAYHDLYVPDSAVAFLKMAFQAGARDDAVLTSLGEAFLWKKDFRSAGEVLDLVKDKEGPASLKVIARKHEILGEFTEAVRLYDLAIDREQLPYGTMERKAIILSWMKKYDEAIAQFDAILKEKIVSRPLKIRCRIRKAEVLSWTGKFDEAVAGLDAVLALDKRNVDARLVKGKVLEWKGEYRPARKVYEEVLRLEPANDQAKLRLEKLAWVE